jgi:bacterial/archaeal transporter family protein
MWLILIIFSAIFLGVYDVFKKLSLSGNAVLPVMLVSSATSLLLFLPLLIISNVAPNLLENSIFLIPSVENKALYLIAIKTLIVQASWIFSFFALKHLPISIVSPIRSTGPMWTLLGAIVILGERLTLTQWIGVAIIVTCLYAYSLAGKKEGIHFKNNIWVLFIFIGTMLGSLSALYDKYLIATCDIDKMAVQAWFCVFQFTVMIPTVLLFWYPKRLKTDAFEWRWTIPCIGIFLVLADFFYFFSLSQDGALISIVSIIRRSGVIVSFISGAIIFKEQNLQVKGFILTGVLIGVFVLWV